MDFRNLIDSKNSLRDLQEEDRPARWSAPKLTRIVTTSWDGGSRGDLEIAEMLAARRLSGTFYIPVKGHHKSSRMDVADLRVLDSRRFEIGAFGVVHQNLCSCDAKQLTLEVERGKARLEDDIGKQVSMFAYPQGRTNPRVIASLKSAGYKGARTTAPFTRGLSFDPYRMPISARAFPHARFAYLRTLGHTLDVRRAWMYAAQYRRARNWVDLAKLIFDSVEKTGGIWHLYGESREVHELRLWDGLREVLDYVANRPGVLYVANGSLVNLRAAKFVGAESYAPRPAV